jgi:hypothetical protein
MERPNAKMGEDVHNICRCSSRAVAVARKLMVAVQLGDL